MVPTFHSKKLSVTGKLDKKLKYTSHFVSWFISIKSLWILQKIQLFHFWISSHPIISSNYSINKTVKKTPQKQLTEMHPVKIAYYLT